MTISAGAAYGALCQVKMIYGGLVLLFTLFQFILKKIKKIEKCAPTLLCSWPEQKKKYADAPLPSNENLIKLRTLLSMYNPEHHSPQILSIYKDVWIRKIEDAYYAYNCSSVHLNDLEEEEFAPKRVHDDVLRFVVKTLNKSSLSVNLSTSTIAANVSDVSTSDVASTTVDAAELEVNPDDSNESSKSMETIAESNPKVIEEVAPQNQVVSKAPVTNEMVRGPNGSMISRAVADKMFAFLIAHSNAVFGNKADTNLKPDVEEANDVAQAHPHPEDVPSPVLSHRDRGRSDEIILDLSGCPPSQIIQKLKNRAVPDPVGPLYDTVHIHSEDPIEEKDVSIKSCARLRSSNRSPSRCRRKDSRSW